MVPLGDGGDQAQIEAGFDTGAEVGKRYADEEAGIECACTKGWPGHALRRQGLAAEGPAAAQLGLSGGCRGTP